jgi:hypothetical protein
MGGPRGVISLSPAYGLERAGKKRMLVFVDRSALNQRSADGLAIRPNRQAPGSISERGGPDQKALLIVRPTR